MWSTTSLSRDGSYYSYASSNLDLASPLTAWFLFRHALCSFGLITLTTHNFLWFLLGAWPLVASSGRNNDLLLQLFIFIFTIHISHWLSTCHGESLTNSSMLWPPSYKWNFARSEYLRTSLSFLAHQDLTSHESHGLNCSKLGITILAWLKSPCCPIFLTTISHCQGFCSGIVNFFFFHTNVCRFVLWLSPFFFPHHQGSTT